MASLTYGIPNRIDETQAFVLRPAAGLNLDTSLLAVPPAYNHAIYQGDTGKPKVKAQRNGMRYLRFELVNAAAASPLGIGFRLDDTYLRIATLAADNTTMSDISDAVKARTATAVQVAGANQTGFVIGYPAKFSCVSTAFTTAETNAAGVTVPDHAVQYSQYGTTWTAYSAAYEDDFTKTDAVWSANPANFVWNAPADWAPNDGTLLGGAWKGLYLLRFTSADREAGDVAAQITGLEIGYLEITKSIAQNASWENEQSALHNRLADGAIAFFGTADAGNRVYAEWEVI